MGRVSHTLSSGKIYRYQAVVLLGKEGVIGCGVGKDKVKSIAVRKAQKNAKKNLVYLKDLKRDQYYTPKKATKCKKGATLVQVYPLYGRSLTASKCGRIYCELSNLKGIRVVTGNKKRLEKGKVGSKLNYYTALHQAICQQVEQI